MASSSSSSSSKFTYRWTLILLVLKIRTQVEGCYTSIYSFGDSLADTGNLLRIYNSNHTNPPYYGSPPYGNTYFHRPTGRFSDGRLVIDFIAEYFGLPLVAPYFGGDMADFRSGANFAVAGATALDNEFLEKRGIYNPMTNISLGLQLNIFKHSFLPSLCRSSLSSNCSEIFQNSLVIVGEIGGNDYNYPFFNGDNFEDIQSMVPLVVNAISSAINELVDLGAVTLLVPGNLPIGCLTAYLTYFMRKTNKEDYDPLTGCIVWLNKFSEYHNEQLQIKLDHARQLHPQVTIIYADYYNAAMRFYSSPGDFGFTGGFRACCGGGEPYNYNSSMQCGTSLSTSCDDPSLNVGWDGFHLTESAYKLIAQGLLKGPFTTPHLTSKCLSRADF